ncbi:hypothetical protein DFH08DRAFT_1021725 [Mycena albidolilacea]|uniref:Uncharacterized protein n=1 Tax=Mycena albidolilacea TaxID=1033008 RepID=A0AAD6ZP81_9AGAR|nr:hypothetical protein DFH08DRAFT_1021725 [Mycena albidolilacea]
MSATAADIPTRPTRSATRAGHFEAPPRVFGPSRSPSPSDGSPAPEENVLASADSTTALYSTAVAGEPVPSEHGLTVDASGVSSVLSEPTPLTSDVDFGQTHRDDDGKQGSWTPVDNKNARSHRERSSSTTSSHKSNSIVDIKVPTTVVGGKSIIDRATAEMSYEELLALSRRLLTLAPNGESMVSVKPQGSAPVVSIPASPVTSTPVQPKVSLPRKEAVNVLKKKFSFGEIDRTSVSDVPIPDSPIVSMGEGPSHPLFKIAGVRSLFKLRHQL